MAKRSAWRIAEIIDSESISKRKFCFHCNDYVPKTTFYRHREQYFDPITQVWTLSEENDNSTLGSEMIENMDISYNNSSVMESTDEYSAFFVSEVSTRPTIDSIDHSIYLLEELSQSTLNQEEVVTTEVRPEGTFINSILIEKSNSNA